MPDQETIAKIEEAKQLCDTMAASAFAGREFTVSFPNGKNHRCKWVDATSGKYLFQLRTGKWTPMDCSRDKSRWDEFRRLTDAE